MHPVRVLAPLLCLLAGCPDGSIQPCPHVELPAGPYLLAPEILDIGGRSYALDAAIVTEGGLPPEISDRFVTTVQLVRLDAGPLPDDLSFTQVAIVRMGLDAWVVPLDELVTDLPTVATCGPEWPIDETYLVVAEVSAPGGGVGRVAKADVPVALGPQ